MIAKTLKKKLPRKPARRAKDAPAARFVKLDVRGNALPAAASDWHAVWDLLTNLIWSRTLPCGRVTQPDAVKQAAEFVLCGRPARLPTRAELLSLVDDTRHSPAIDVSVFPKTGSAWYWTSTPAACSPGVYAWYVDLHSGDADWSFQDYYGFVRACRPGQ